jgi:hypothetical protein
MIGSRHSAMTATLLAVRIVVADFDGLAAAILPFNLNIGFIHADLFSQRSGHPPQVALTFDLTTFARPLWTAGPEQGDVMLPV